MKISLLHHGTSFQADLTKPIDISLPIIPNQSGPNCFFAPPPKIQPVVSGDFIGDTQQGGAVNFMNITLNPHGNGTHTECVGHIAKEKFTINKLLTQFHFLSQLITVPIISTPGGDSVVNDIALRQKLQDLDVPAVVIRTQPNHDEKRFRIYSGTNPPYFLEKSIDFLVEKKVKHLLTDLPSIDPEVDDGQLKAHKSFWQYPDRPRTNSTITELIFVDNEIKDGLYLLNIQVASFELDASPSKPILYELFV